MHCSARFHSNLTGNVIFLSQGGWEHIRAVEQKIVVKFWVYKGMAKGPGKILVLKIVNVPHFWESGVSHWRNPFKIAGCFLTCLYCHEKITREEKDLKSIWQCYRRHDWQSQHYKTICQSSVCSKRSQLKKVETMRNIDYIEIMRSANNDHNCYLYIRRAPHVGGGGWRCGWIGGAPSSGEEWDHVHVH